MIKQELVVKFGDNETLIYQKNKGIICKEPSKIAFSKKGKRLFLEEVGLKAKNLIGKTDGTVWIDSPFKNCAVDNLDLATMYFKQLLESYVETKTSQLFVIFLLNCALTAEEKRQFEILAINCGIRKYAFVPCVVFDIIGNKFDVNEIEGKLVVDIGSESTELALISNGNIINGYSIELGGCVLDKKIANFLYEKYSLTINENDAENIKKKIGSLYQNDLASYSFVANDALTRTGTNVTLLSKDIYPILAVFYDKISEGISIFLNQISPEFLKDITNNGILITGGNSKVVGIESFFKSRLKLNVFTPEDIYENFNYACGELLSNKSLLKKIVNKN